MKRAWMGLCLAIAAGTAQAETLDLDFSSRAVHGAFDGPLASVFPRLSGVYEIGGLAGSIDSSSYKEGVLGFLVTGDAGAEKANVNAGLGPRVAIFHQGPVDGGALALGGMVEARLPAFNRVGARGYLYAAPRASSFSDLKGYIEYSADADYQVLRNASLYLGFRELEVKVRNAGNFTVDTGWHIGLRLTF